MGDDDDLILLSERLPFLRDSPSGYFENVMAAPSFFEPDCSGILRARHQRVQAIVFVLHPFLVQGKAYAAVCIW